MLCEENVALQNVKAVGKYSYQWTVTHSRNELIETNDLRIILHKMTAEQWFGWNLALKLHSVHKWRNSYMASVTEYCCHVMKQANKCVHRKNETERNIRKHTPTNKQTNKTKDGISYGDLLVLHHTTRRQSILKPTWTHSTPERERKENELLP
jgi:hypothetical protein